MWIWAVVIIIAVWLITKRSQKSNLSQNEGGSSSAINDKIEEDFVFKVQGGFEKNLENTYLPDAVNYRDLYIYKYLMKSWFSELSGKYRYDESMIQKLRKDWLDYMEALEDRGTYSFLSLEAQTEEQRESYREKHIVASRKAFAIQDAFAVAIGKGAVKKLADLQEKDIFAFTREGELASDEESEK
ncbi:hypothetical protein IT400_03370 [Candidatus Nomurabacteria bacterium]|nr:hypothetical protein [Candidatus Nomurabacteria bacterium]